MVIVSNIAAFTPMRKAGPVEDLYAQGIIGSVKPRHVSFARNQPDDVSTIRLGTGPSAAARLRQDGVDVVILTPV